MELFRIAQAKYANALTSSGSANRWNKEGQHVLYCGSSRSLATLELIVHKSSVKPQVSYKVMVISVADDDHLVSIIKLGDLPKKWNQLSAYWTLQAIGSDWYESKETLLLQVPSAVIPKEYNYMINTKHPEFSNHVTLVRLEDYFWDDRLLNS